MKTPTLPVIMKPKTVDGVMGVFSKTMSDLEKVAETNKMKAAGISLKRAELAKEEAAANNEAARADKFRNNLSRMLEE